MKEFGSSAVFSEWRLNSVALNQWVWFKGRVYLCGWSYSKKWSEVEFTVKIFLLFLKQRRDYRSAVYDEKFAVLLKGGSLVADGEELPVLLEEGSLVADGEELLVLLEEGSRGADSEELPVLLEGGSFE